MKIFKLILFTLATLFFLTFSHSAVSAHPPDLHEGVSGAEVKELQVKLQKLGYFNVAATGYYGSITKDAVINFQRDFGVSATGFTGPQTREKMKQVDMMARNSKGKMVKIEEVGWSLDEPTHVVMYISSSNAGVFRACEGNTLWVDNLRWVFEKP